MSVGVPVVLGFVWTRTQRGPYRLRRFGNFALGLLLLVGGFLLLGWNPDWTVDEPLLQLGPPEPNPIRINLAPVVGMGMISMSCVQVILYFSCSSQAGTLSEVGVAALATDLAPLGLDLATSASEHEDTEPGRAGR